MSIDVRVAEQAAVDDIEQTREALREQARTARVDGQYHSRLGAMWLAVDPRAPVAKGLAGDGIDAKADRRATGCRLGALCQVRTFLEHCVGTEVA